MACKTPIFDLCFISKTDFSDTELNMATTAEITDIEFYVRKNGRNAIPVLNISNGGIVVISDKTYILGSTMQELPDSVYEGFLYAKFNGSKQLVATSTITISEKGGCCSQDLATSVSFEDVIVNIIITQTLNVWEGLTGESAYEYAIRTGAFAGTEQEWYNSLTEPSVRAIEAIEEANAATAHANQAAENANTVTTQLQEVGVEAASSIAASNESASEANAATALANEATSLAVSATQNVVQAIDQVNQAKQETITATANANNTAAATQEVISASITETQKAITATDNATTAASLAITAKEIANAATDNANQARDGANAAKDNANTAANTANAATVQTNIAKDAANAAAQNINSKVELDNRTAGNLLRGNGLIFESIPEVDFLRNKEAFSKSFLGGIHNLDFLRVFDSFKRLNSTDLGTTDSGTVIVKLRGTSGRILNNTCTITNEGDINAVAVNITNTDRCRIRVVNNVQVLGFRSPFFIYFLKDVNNGLIFKSNLQFIQIDKIVNGVITNLVSSLFISGANHRAINANSLAFEADLVVGRFGGSSSYDSSAILRQDINPSAVSQVLTSSLFNPNEDNVFANPTDIKFIGWGGSNNLAIFIDE